MVTTKGLLVITLITWTLPRIIGLSPFITLVSCLFNVTIFHLEGDSWIINSVDTDCGVDTYSLSITIQLSKICHSRRWPIYNS